MAGVVFRGVTKVYDDQVVAVSELDLEIEAGEPLVPAGRSGPRSRGEHGRRDPDRRPARERRLAGGAEHRDGVPELRALPAYDGAQEHGARAEDPRHLPGAAGRPGRARSEDAEPLRAPRPEA